MTYRFGQYRADRTAYRVFDGSRPLELTPKLLDLLFYLLDRPATLVTKEELLDGVWPDANVTDNALAQAVSELREALGDSASAPTYIRTVARRGYRFIAPVEPGEVAANAATDGTSTGRADTAPMSAPRTIAVLDFSNVTGDADVAWLAAGIPETVTSDLAGLGQFRVIDRWRVMQTSRHGGGTIEEIGAALSVGLVVTGSFQRIGPNLRVTARVVDLETGEAVADAKVDGLLEDIFALQDSIVSTFAQELGVPPSQSRNVGRRGGRETSNLDAFRAYTEGWLKIESLDTDLVASSIRDFERAIALDPSYALAHTGLANAAFVAHEMTRATLDPNHEALEAGVEHARRAIRLDERLAEAHATLSFLLTPLARFAEARAAAQQAVAIEPDGWRHQYRLGHAMWGALRIKALERAVALYPQFSYALFEASMVHVARGDLALAEELGRRGVAEQDRQSNAGNRYPGVGFHWLLGALASAQGRHRDAIAEFERERLLVDPRRLYGSEYGALALVGRGHAELAEGDHDAAVVSFGAAREHVPGYPRAYIGEALAHASAGDAADAAAARRAASSSMSRLHDTGRHHDALYVEACQAATEGEFDVAVDRLSNLLALGPPSFFGWTIPIEPCFCALREDSGFDAVLKSLADRAK